MPAISHGSVCCVIIRKGSTTRAVFCHGSNNERESVLSWTAVLAERRSTMKTDWKQSYQL